MAYYFQLAGMVRAIGSLSRLVIVGFQVRFPGLAHSFLSSITGERMSTEYWLTAFREVLGIYVGY